MENAEMTLKSESLRNRPVSDNLTYYLKAALVTFLSVGLVTTSLIPINQPFFDTAIYCSASATADQRAMIGTFNVVGDRSMDITSMMPTLDGWRSRDISYSWDNIKSFYNLDSLAVHEYRDESSSNIIYVIIIPADVNSVEFLHPLEYCYNVQGYRLASQNVTTLRLMKYFGMEKSEFSFDVNMWKLVNDAHSNKNWLITFGYMFLSTGRQLADRVYMVQVEYYLSGDSSSRAVENSLLFMGETVTSITRRITQTL